MLNFDLNLSLDKTAIDHMLHAPSGDVAMWLTRKGIEMEEGARANLVAHNAVKTGRLGLCADNQRQHARPPRNHEGTRPHLIVDLEGMTFTNPQGKTTTKKVRHPGFKGNKFLTAQLKLLRTK